ncbi:MAG: hypothetical protein J6Y91_06160 [Alphaproteobacteria bacterium]|nr:hypothetical protein [Alphaproteobacteria bacterium]
MNALSLTELWQQTEMMHLAIAAVSGLLVGAAYFGSLRWSIDHMAQSKHKIAVYAGLAVLRIMLFFGILIAIAGDDLTLIAVYVVAFLVMRMAAFALDRKHFLQQEQEKKTEHD